MARAVLTVLWFQPILQSKQIWGGSFCNQWVDLSRLWHEFDAGMRYTRLPTLRTSITAARDAYSPLSEERPSSSAGEGISKAGRRVPASLDDVRVSPWAWLGVTPNLIPARIVRWPPALLLAAFFRGQFG